MIPAPGADDRLRLLTVRQAAERLACSPANVYALIEAGDLPVVPVGKRKGYRLDERDLVRFVQGRKFVLRPAETPGRVRLKHLKL